MKRYRRSADKLVDKILTPEEVLIREEEEKEAMARIAAALGTLNLLEQKIIRNLHLIDPPKSHVAVARWIGLSVREVKRLERVALQKMAAHFFNQN